MPQPSVLQWAIGGLAVLVAVGLFYIWRRVSRADAARPEVRVLGLYSPILTWLRYPRLANGQAPLAKRPGLPAQPVPTFFASQTTQPTSGIPQPAAGGPARSDTPSLWDLLRQRWITLPDAMRDWARANLNLPALWRSWSGVLINPSQETEPVGVRVAWRDVGLEWLLVGLVVLSFCSMFLKFGSKFDLPG